MVNLEGIRDYVREYDIIPARRRGDYTGTLRAGNVAKGSYTQIASVRSSRGGRVRTRNAYQADSRRRPRVR